MKICKRISLFLFAILLMNNANAITTPEEGATSPIKTTEMIDKIYPADKVLTPKQAKRKAKLEKAIDKFEHKLAKVNAKRAAKGKPQIDFNDPVEKWLWFAIFAGGAALLLSILAGALASTGGFFRGGLLGLLAAILWLGAVVSIVIWLIQKFG